MSDKKCPECGYDNPIHSLSCGRRFGLVSEGDGKKYLEDLNDGHGCWNIEPGPWSPDSLNAGY